MSTSYITPKQTAELSNRQLYSLENGLSKGHFDLNDIGELLPGAIMVHNIQELKITYMNSWGCETLNHSMDEINAMGVTCIMKNSFFPRKQNGLFRACSTIIKEKIILKSIVFSTGSEPALLCNQAGTTRYANF